MCVCVCVCVCLCVHVQTFHNLGNSIFSEGSTVRVHLLVVALEGRVKHTIFQHDWVSKEVAR